MNFDTQFNVTGSKANTQLRFGYVHFPLLSIFIYSYLQISCLSHEMDLPTFYTFGTKSIFSSSDGFSSGQFCNQLRNLRF